LRSLRQIGACLALALAISAVAGCRDSRPASAAEAPKPVEEPRPVVRATLSHLNGEVWVKRARGSDWERAVEAMSLYDNDKVRTARGGTALIQFVGGSELTMGEDALVGIAEEKPAAAADPADVTVLRGRIDATLPAPKVQSITVSTPSATIRAGREIVFQ
jgi:hypothetical protein